MTAAQAMAAAADDDHVVGIPRLGRAPDALPSLVIIERVAQQAEDRISAHGFLSAKFL
mgnify:CR=1 FL=1